MRRRKQKDLQALQHDYNFLFYVGRLVGAAEVTSYWLQMQTEDPQSNEMGRRLGMVTTWFLSDEPDSEITQILPPK